MIEKYQMSSKDCGILLPSGKLEFTKELQEIWIQQANFFRKMRADVLALSFQVESSIDEIISEVFFPGMKNLPSNMNTNEDIKFFMNQFVLKNTFIELFLKSSSTFGTKIRVFLQIFETIEEIKKMIGKNLKKDLDKTRNIRNAFAHKPITFKYANSSELKLSGFMSFGNKIIELTQTECDKMVNSIKKTNEELINLLKNLEANANRVGESIEFNNAMWLYHNALDDNSWEIGDHEKPINLEDIWIGSLRKSELNVELQDED